jgi:hypothetical protein
MVHNQALDPIYNLLRPRPSKLDNILGELDTGVLGILTRLIKPIKKKLLAVVHFPIQQVQ